MLQVINDGPIESWVEKRVCQIWTQQFFVFEKKRLLRRRQGADEHSDIVNHALRLGHLS